MIGDMPLDKIARWRNVNGPFYLSGVPLQDPPKSGEKQEPKVLPLTGAEDWILTLQPPETNVIKLFISVIYGYS
jgi:hypothetical protein